MNIKILIGKHLKLWEKFFANLANWQVSRNRQIIKLFKALWFLVFWPLEIASDLVALFRKARRYPLPEKPKILIIKIDQLGDLLFSTWLLPALKQEWPQAEIDYLINPRNETVLQNNPHIKHIYHWQDSLLGNIPGRQRSSRLKSSWATKKILKARQYDLVINARAFWPSSNRQWRKLGRNLAAFDLSQLSGLADIVVSYDLRAWEEDNYKRLLEAIGVRAEIITKLEARGEFYNFIQDADLPPGKYHVLAPVSFDPEKTWTIDEWIRFSQRFLEDNPEETLLASSTEKQGPWLEKIKKGLSGQGLSDRFIIRNDLSLGQLAEAIKGSQGFIGLESFPAHLAIALRKPVSCLVNTRLFYVPGLSKNRLVDGRSMLTRSKDIRIIDLDSIDFRSAVRGNI